MSVKSRVAPLLFLLAANLFLATGCLWFATVTTPRAQWLGSLAIGLIFGQVMTLAMWLAMGDGKWYGRLALAAFATVLLAQSITWAEVLARWQSSPSVNDEAEWTRLVLLVVLLLGFTALWPLRQFGQWRLTWRSETHVPPPPLQFSTRDLLLWMVVIGGTLGALRLLQEATGERNGLFRFVVQMIGMIVLIAAAMAAALGRSHFIRRVAILCALVLLIAGASVGFAAWERFSAESSNFAWQVRLHNALRSTVPESMAFLSATGAALLNGIALQALGCTLIRPKVIAQYERQPTAS